MSARIVSALPAEVALEEIRERLDEYMRIWHDTNVKKTRDHADGCSDGLAMAAGLLAGTTAFDELKASDKRIGCAK